MKTLANKTLVIQTIPTLALMSVSELRQLMADAARRASDVALTARAFNARGSR